MKLSKIASIILGGSLIIAATGCGWWDDDDNGGGKASVQANAQTTAADGYILATGVSANGVNILQKENNKTYLITLTKPANQLTDQNISVSGYIDINVNYTVDENDTLLAFPLLTKGVTKYVNPVTTLAVKANDDTLLKKAANFDPVQDVKKVAENNTTKTLLILNRMVADIANNDPTKLDVLAKAVKEANISNLSDPETVVKNISNEVKKVDLKLADAIKSVKTKVENVIQLIQKKPDVDVVKVVTALMDAPANIKEELLKEADINTSDISSILNQIKDAEKNISNAVPVKLSLTSVNLGDNLLNIPVIPTLDENNNSISIGTFGTIRVNDDNLSKYYNVEIITNKNRIKDLNENWFNNGKIVDDNVSFTMTITNELNNSQKVQLKIENVRVVLDRNNTEPLKVIMNSDTIIRAYQEGLGGFSYLGSGTEVSANVNTELVNTDLVFDVDTILNNLAASEDNAQKLKTTIDELNNYFKKTGKFSVEMNLSVSDGNNLSKALAFTKVKGTVLVNTETNHAPVINKVEVEVGETKNATQVDEESSFEIEVNATDADGDTLTYYLYDGDTFLCSGFSDYDRPDIHIFEPSAPSVDADTTKTYTVKVCDIWGACDTEDIIITVKNTDKNSAPVLKLNATSLTVNVGETNSTTYTATDSDGDNVTVTAKSNDTSVAIVDVDKEKKQIQVTGISEGNATITVKACDEFGACAEQNVSVEVKDSNEKGSVSYNTIVSEYNLSRNDYNHYYVAASLTGTLSSDLITIKTTATLPDDKPIQDTSNLQTVYLVETSGDTNNFIEFKFKTDKYPAGTKFEVTVGNKKAEIVSGNSNNEILLQ